MKHGWHSSLSLYPLGERLFEFLAASFTPHSLHHLLKQFLSCPIVKSAFTYAKPLLYQSLTACMWIALVDYALNLCGRDILAVICPSLRGAYINDLIAVLREFILIYRIKW